MTPCDRAWDMGSYTEYMWVYDGICHGVRIPDEPSLPLRLPVTQTCQCRIIGSPEGHSGWHRCPSYDDFKLDSGTPDETVLTSLSSTQSMPAAA